MTRRASPVNPGSDDQADGSYTFTSRRIESAYRETLGGPEKEDTIFCLFRHSPLKRPEQIQAMLFGLS